VCLRSKQQQQQQQREHKKKRKRGESPNVWGSRQLQKGNQSECERWAFLEKAPKRRY
jgi:hypothetical protein